MIHSLIFNLVHRRPTRTGVALHLMLWSVPSLSSPTNRWVHTTEHNFPLCEMLISRKAIKSIGYWSGSATYDVFSAGLALS